MSKNEEFLRGYGAEEQAQAQAEQKRREAAERAKVRSEQRNRERMEREQFERAALEDFYAYLPQHKYLYIPTRDLWPAESVNGCIPWLHDDAGNLRKPSAILDAERPIEQLVWAPGSPQIISDVLLDQGGWVNNPGSCIFNLYRPPAVIRGDARAAARWRDHLHAVYPEDGDHLEQWFAQRIQHPGVKINHAVVLGGMQGIGKDSLLEPVKMAVGPWNWSEISPPQMLGRFNGWAKSVIVRLSEARDLGESDRFAFYDHSKNYITAPPDVLRVDEKNIREHYVLNVLGLVITTNHRTDGIYLPPDDRRHFVAWSEIAKSEFGADYWTSFWQWYGQGGLEDVATYLRELDISGFDPKAPPPHTRGFDAIVHANLSQEDSELGSLVEMMHTPPALTLGDLRDAASLRQFTEAIELLTDRRLRRRVPYSLERSGYIVVANPNTKDGRWKINGHNVTIYARSNLTFNEQTTVVEERIRRGADGPRSP